MDQIILHNYPLSPFVQKARRMLAFKRIAWHDVEVPMILPKPTFIPLTGGYRRVPVMQIGADIYCDTTIIARRLDQLRPEPPLIPAAQEGMVNILADWGDHRTFLWSVIATYVTVLPQLSDEFVADRTSMDSRLNRAQVERDAPYCISQVRFVIESIDKALQDRPFLLGDALTVADLACYHPIWFSQHRAEVFNEAMSYPRLKRWYEAIDQLGDGEHTSMSPEEALEIARRSTPSDIDANGGEKRGTGIKVSVAADDYGCEPSVGTLVRHTHNEIAISRYDDRVGDVVLHFPCLGYRVDVL